MDITNLTCAYAHHNGSINVVHHHQNGAATGIWTEPEDRQGLADLMLMRHLHEEGADLSEIQLPGRQERSAIRYYEGVWSKGPPSGLKLTAWTEGVTVNIDHAAVPDAIARYLGLPTIRANAAHRHRTDLLAHQDGTLTMVKRLQGQAHYVERDERTEPTGEAWTFPFETPTTVAVVTYEEMIDMTTEARRVGWVLDGEMVLELSDMFPLDRRYFGLIHITSDAPVKT